MADVGLTIVHGDSATLEFAVRTADGSAYNLATSTVAFAATNGTQSLTKTATVTDEAGGLCSVTIDAGDTSAWPTTVRPLTWDLVVTTGGSLVYTVAHGTLSVEYVAPPLPSSAPAAPDVCLLSGAVLAPGGSGEAGALVRARVIGTSPVAAGGGHASGGPTVTYTGIDGIWSVTLPQGLTVWLEIPAAGVDHYLTVPAAATATLSGLVLTERVS